uniref:uncharacterized protein LOC122606761 n=1 Tax=Erigeron canadensis TaxID=72917 RepID=UPI001CB8A1B7|nr:uncharacterized protein LOC122606761 [Erigeron canadensis]
MPVSESEKLGGVSVVGVGGEKGEQQHIIPIKKRRIFLSPPSPTNNLSFLGAAETHSPKAAHGELLLLNPNCLPSISGNNNDDDEKKVDVKTDDDYCEQGSSSSVVTTKTDEIFKKLDVTTSTVSEQVVTRISGNDEKKVDVTTSTVSEEAVTRISGNDEKKQDVKTDDDDYCEKGSSSSSSVVTKTDEISYVNELKIIKEEQEQEPPDSTTPSKVVLVAPPCLELLQLASFTSSDTNNSPPPVRFTWDLNTVMLDAASEEQPPSVKNDNRTTLFVEQEKKNNNDYTSASQNILKSHLAHETFSVAVKTESSDAIIPVTITNLTVPVKTESSDAIPVTDTVMPKHDLSSENGPLWRRKMELTTNVVIKEEAVDHITVGYANLQNDKRAGYGVDDKQDKHDPQYEDGQLRESSTHAWKECELKNNEQYEYDMENTRPDVSVVVDHALRETSSQNGQGGGGSSKVTEAGFGGDLTSSLVLPQKLNNSDEILSGFLVPNENRETQVQNANRSEWKINVSSGCDILPENQPISSNISTKTKNFTGRKFFYGEPKDRFETEDVEMTAQGSRFYRKESLTRIAGPSTRDEYVSRDRFWMQGCSSKADDGFTSRPERELDGFRSFRRGRYSPHHLSSGRGVGMWNRSPERGRNPKRLLSPSYQGPSFARPMLDDSGTVDNMTNEGGMDSSRHARSNTSSYVTRRPFRSRSPLNREAQDFRARLGLRPSGDMGHDRFVNLGRGRGQGRSVRYGTTLDDDGPRGRYHGPANDECDEYLTEYPRPFPRRRRCFSPIERRGNTSTYQHHQSNSRSPSRPRTRSPIGNTGFRRRSRSPDFRHDTRIWRPKSPNCRDHANECNSGPRNNNSSPMSSRWVNYKERPVFDRRSPPPGRTNAPQGERFSIYDSRKKQNEYYRSGPPGHFSDLKESGRGRPRYVENDSDRPDNGYRRGRFVRQYNMDTPTKRFHFDEDELGCGFDASDQHALELLARENLNSNMLGKHIF